MYSKTQQKSHAKLKEELARELALAEVRKILTAVIPSVGPVNTDIPYGWNRSMPPFWWNLRAPSSTPKSGPNGTPPPPIYPPHYCEEGETHRHIELVETSSL
jgi:hypothetical protein